MTSNNGHVDGDDYTWDGEPSGRAVLKPVPAWAAAWQRGEYVALDAPALAALAAASETQAGPDLRTADQVERDDVAALAVRLEWLEAFVTDSLQSVADVAIKDVGLETRITTLEATVTKLMTMLEVRL